MSQKIERTLIFRITLFLAASVVTVLTIPSETVFRYEVRQGSPWAYPDLIASSDFPIAKSEARLQREKDSLIADMKPYYTYDSTVFENTMTLLQNTLQSAELKMIEKQASETGKPLKQAQAMRDSFAFFKKELTLVITENAQKNVLENLPPDKKIIILHGKLATEKLTENCLSEKDFYNKMKGFESRFASEIYPKLNYLLFVAPNTMPDPDTYETVKEERLSSLSLNSGMIQSGERIIAKGELISESKQRILYSYRQFLEEDADSTENKAYAFLGQWVVFLFFYAIFFVSIHFFEKRAFKSMKQMIYFVSGSLFFTILASFSARYEDLSPFLIPVLILPVLTVTFYRARTAIWHHTITLAMMSFIVPNGHEYFIIQFVSGFAIAAILTHLRRRGQILQAAFWVFLVQIIMFLALVLVYENSFANLHYPIFVWIFVNTLFIPVAYPLMYLFERVFGFVSDVTLLELADTNRPLLRELSEKAPGTFQHSMQVANLAEEAIRKINGNALLVRAGALYHDIGKSVRSAYFTENQLSGKNLHDGLPPEESAQIIIDHVTQGVKLAEKHHLPQQISEFITSHHADSKVRWFLHAYKTMHEGEDIDESLFTYHGLKPESKEAAVVMMADAVEAASRSLKNYDKDSISEIVDRLIDYQISEGHFARTNLTFAELTTIRQAFKDKLLNVYHSRIEYPKD